MYIITATKCKSNVTVRNEQAEGVVKIAALNVVITDNLGNQRMQGIDNLNDAKSSRFDLMALLIWYARDRFKGCGCFSNNYKPFDRS